MKHLLAPLRVRREGSTGTRTLKAVIPALCGRVLATALAASVLGTPVAAQWLNQPTPGIPRLADGKPDLRAPAPRTSDGKPDISGQWLFPQHPGYVGNIAADLDPMDVQAWADASFAAHMAELGKDDPWTIGCQPAGPRAITTVPRIKIIQTPAVIVVLFEDLTYRQIFMDGRALPEDPFPNFMGYSIGRWDGDELVVESAGFNDQTWLDYGGHPHTESLRVTERFRRTNFGHLQRRVTLNDPKTFKKPITLANDGVLAADTELLETVCTETPRDRFVLGPTPEQRGVQVAPDVLAKYVGTYELKEAATFGIREFRVSLSGRQLLVDFNGKGRMPLIPLSERMFSPRLLGTYEFVTDDRGVASQLLVHAVEGTFTATRRPDATAR
jgi:hypothetical protein